MARDSSPATFLRASLRDMETDAILGHSSSAGMESDEELLDSLARLEGISNGFVYIANLLASKSVEFSFVLLNLLLSLIYKEQSSEGE